MRHESGRCEALKRKGEETEEDPEEEYEGDEETEDEGENAKKDQDDEIQKKTCETCKNTFVSGRWR